MPYFTEEDLNRQFGVPSAGLHWHVDAANWYAQQNGPQWVLDNLRRLQESGGMGSSQYGISPFRGWWTGAPELQPSAARNPYRELAQQRISTKRKPTVRQAAEASMAKQRELEGRRQAYRHGAGGMIQELSGEPGERSGAGGMIRQLGGGPGERSGAGGMIRALGGGEGERSGAGGMIRNLGPVARPPMNPVAQAQQDYIGRENAYLAGVPTPGMGGQQPQRQAMPGVLGIAQQQMMLQQQLQARQAAMGQGQSAPRQSEIAAPSTLARPMNFNPMSYDAGPSGTNVSPEAIIRRYGSPPPGVSLLEWARYNMRYNAMQA